ncbi:GGDEF domain-containing protein [Alteromonas sp. C1M14]|uniref:GGDEF domain-containing protein n=1 Tax=Alteromonas sp. C1M14 TaxID=2841567 RepID=UPI001C09DD65|nr:GGDEF domain-containing protein [Alteromonas sp. C1M14]MBU2977911.1 GGDEF domain-containing protein [Alteromonas sp. C1M14]
MNSVYRARQSHLIGGSIATQALALYLCFSHGITKAAAQIAWLDVVGEGSVLVFALSWIVAAIVSRPPGRVTTLLIVGLNCFAFTTMLDFLDEVFSYSLASDWLSMLESIPAAVGMVVMTIALVAWHGEQKALNKQLQRREWTYRDHHQIDAVTQLYQADYWQERVEELCSRKLTGCALMLDINGFSQFNQIHGYQEGNRFLQEIARLLVMHVRENDLVCRFAGDRFVLLLPNTHFSTAAAVARQIEVSVHHLAFKSGVNTTAVFQSVRTATLRIDGNKPVAQILANLQEMLDKPRHQAA